jgi:hypothetical protein
MAPYPQMPWRKRRKYPPPPKLKSIEPFIIIITIIIISSNHIKPQHKPDTYPSLSPSHAQPQSAGE